MAYANCQVEIKCTKYMIKKSLSKKVTLSYSPANWFMVPYSNSNRLSNRVNLS